MKKPNFFIIGAAKCGTTSLYTWLKQHPEIGMSKNKEPAIFSRLIQSPYEIQDYDTLYPKRQYKILGEASTIYLYDKDSANLIQKTLGDNIKIIVCLRNPVDMVYSLWKYNVRDGSETLSFENALEQENMRFHDKKFRSTHPNSFPNFFYKRRALFGQQLDRYYKYFSKKNIHIIFLDEMENNPLATLKKIFKFLEIEYHPINTIKKNISGGLWSKNIHNFLKSKKHPLRKPFRRLPKSLKIQIWNTLYTMNMKNYNNVFPKLGETTYSKLMPLFKTDIKYLENITEIPKIYERWQ